MVKKITQTELLKQFIEEGATSGEASNAKIIGNQFIHFSTPILERNGNVFVYNESKYSDVTRFLQRKILQMLDGKEFKTVNRIDVGYSGSLNNFLK